MPSALVTGAASGIGLALTQMLLTRGWSVAAVVRTRLPQHDVLDRATRAGRLRTYNADLADAAQRRALVEEVSSGEQDLDVFFSNAGVSTGTLQRSPQGHELHYEVNCLAPYVLVEGLRPSLAHGAGGQVVHTMSDAFEFARSFDPDRLSDPERFRVAFGPYATSKLALALWSHALVPDLAQQGISMTSVVPRMIRTPMSAGPGLPALMRPIARVFGKSPEHAAGLLLDATQAGHPSGSYVRSGRARPLPHVEQAARVLETVARDAGVHA